MAKSVRKLYSEEVKAQRDYRASAKAAASRGDKRMVKTLRHIRREESGHAKELVSLSSLAGRK